MRWLILILLFLPVNVFAADFEIIQDMNGNPLRLIPLTPEWQEVYEEKGKKYFVEVTSMTFNWRHRDVEFWLKISGDKEEIHECSWFNNREWLFGAKLYEGPEIAEKYKTKRKYWEFLSWKKTKTPYKACVLRIMEIVQEEPDRINILEPEWRVNYDAFRMGIHEFREKYKEELR